jgi:O-antigen/teichoic acid export membrane protein
MHPPEAQPETTGPEAPKTRGLRQLAMRGAVLTIGQLGVKNILRFGSNLVLAYLLFPEAFALVVLCSIVVQGLEMLTDFGIKPAVIRSARAKDPAFLKTAWTMQLSRSCALWITAAALAHPVAIWYHEPLLTYLIPVYALTLVWTGFESMGVTTAVRELALVKFSIYSFGETFIKTGITIVWAFISPSVWALIGGTLITNALSAIVSHILFPQGGLRFTWDRTAVAEIRRFGGWVFVSTLLTYLSQQMDRIILGKLVSISVLGVYSIALNLARLPLDIAFSVMGWVLYPALAEIVRRDPKQLDSRLKEARGAVLAAAQFSVCGVMLFSPWFFWYLYDARYADAAHFTPFLAVSTWFAILQSSASQALTALGDVRSLARSNLVKLAVTTTGCLVGHYFYEMTGFIAGIGLGSLAAHLSVSHSLGRHGIRILKQDSIYTAVVGVIAIVCLGIPLLAADDAHYVEMAALSVFGFAASSAIALRALGPLLGRLRSD